jgi:phosphoribosylanthranilate isomerase
VDSAEVFWQGFRLLPGWSLMPIDVKICGLSTGASVAAAVAGGATHIGFIFFPKSPRNVSAEQARDLVLLAGGGARSVAVTVDANDVMLDGIVAVMRPDMLQLHGSETPARVAEVKARFGLPVMKALSVRHRRDLDKVVPYIGIADRFLLDAKPPSGSELPGGNGISFDWTLLDHLDRSVDYMLSGGVNAGNVADAIALTGASGVDVSSGVESAPGKKDPERIAEFLRKARAPGQKRRDIRTPERGEQGRTA